MKNIAVVVPTIESRAEIFKTFMEAWEPLFTKHKVEFIKVLDGESPMLYHDNIWEFTLEDVMGEYADCLTNFNAGIRNLGFAYIARNLPDVKYIITLDDDEIPIGDTIADHLDALNKRVPVSWISTAVDDYTRGFPYGIRDEAEVVLSHGVWEGVADWDAPTQLVRGSHRPVDFYRGPVPKGIYFPVCSMNLAFKRCMLPYIYQAPWAEGVKRFDDILTGVEAKREIDKHGWAAVTGYARVLHERASNVFTNLENEATGMRLNEQFWQGVEEHIYFKTYRKMYKKWQQYLRTYQ
jgi:reversibly glycosylated polypeptide/UDP-arabinopyranose mutase